MVQKNYTGRYLPRTGLIYMYVQCALLGCVCSLALTVYFVARTPQLFQQCMSAARQAIDMVRTLQRLVGTVERVTELLELLEQISSTAHEDNLVIVLLVQFTSTPVPTHL